ncbi:MAG TPA: Hsp20 family protein [Kofleriaceae bacterium]|nr:Hsp20 family protein [Kofleriaceae bacterium]
MQAELIEVMHQQVQAIHRALTGDDPPELDPVAPETEEPDAVIASRFAELAAIARSIPALSARVPATAFAPPLDIIATEGAVVIEVALCGVRRGDLDVERTVGALVISGVRRDAHADKGRRFHAELPRGPFLRVVPLPFATERAPRIELEDGLLRIYLDVDLDVDATVMTNKGQENGQ